MSSVTDIAVAAPVESACPVNEVVSMYIVLISVPVVIRAIAFPLSRIAPHIGSKVRVVPLHSLINDCNNHIRITCTKCPCLGNIEVSSFLGGWCPAFVSGIFICPLIYIIWVIEPCLVNDSRLRPGNIREGLPHIVFLDYSIVFDP